MTISYSYSYKLLPNEWRYPTPPLTGETENYVELLTYRRAVSSYISDWFNVLFTWRHIFKYIIFPLNLLLLAIGFHWIIFLILTAISSYIYLFIRHRIKKYQEALHWWIVIDEVIANEIGIRLPVMLSNEE
jgi:hypothetical protein